MIPIEPRGKRPLVSWTGYQRRTASEEEVRAWWTRWPDANIGIVTGRVSGIVVVDVDGTAGSGSLRNRAIPPTVVCATGRGHHYYFAHPGFNVANRTHLLPGVDVRGEGGYVVAPPSTHENGKQYAWGQDSSPQDEELARVPDWLAQLWRTDNLSTELVAGVAEGERNVAAARLAGKFLSRGFSARETFAWLLLWNARNKPPLDVKELARVVRSIASREAKRILR